MKSYSKYLISKLNYGSVIYDLHDGNVLQLLIEECLVFYFINRIT